MYSRRLMLILRVFSAALSIAMELLTFYYIFLQLNTVLSDLSPSTVATHDIIFFAILTTMSVWVYELAGTIIALGDKLEQRGELVWKTKTFEKKSQTKRQSL